MELSLLGWDTHFAAALASVGQGLEAGRVFKTVHHGCSVWTASGERQAVLSGALRDAPAHDRPATGDWVALEPATGRIRAVLPRRACLSRKQAGEAYEEQVLAVNVDVLFIVIALDGDFNLRRLERCLMLAEQSGASPVIVLNKSDLCEDLIGRLQQIDRVSHAPVVVMAAIEQGSVAQLHRYVEPTQTAALLGSSGVGKSTIVNALLGEGHQSTAAVREHDSRGRHTTTSRELFLLPQGWLLMDTPGIRELAVWGDAEAVDAAFSSITDLAQLCRFRDCRHAGEPGCAVTEAVIRGELEMAQLHNFQKLHREVDAQARKRLGRIGERAFRKIQHRKF